VWVEGALQGDAGNLSALYETIEPNQSLTHHHGLWRRIVSLIRSCFMCSVPRTLHFRVGEVRIGPRRRRELFLCTLSAMLLLAEGTKFFFLFFKPLLQFLKLYNKNRQEKTFQVINVTKYLRRQSTCFRNNATNSFTRARAFRVRADLCYFVGHAQCS